MGTFFTSDTHFNHGNIIQYCRRPFCDKYEMNRELVQRWNSVVSPADIVCHLGDFSFDETHNFTRQLNGQIVLILGNHDKKVQKNCFVQVADSLEMRVGEFSCLLRHRPVIPVESTDPYVVEAKEEREWLLKTYDFIICGHVHEKWSTYGKNVNVGVDRWNFTPVPHEQLNLYLKTRV